MFEIFYSLDAWVALFGLVFLEIILGVDNIIFISLAADKLPETERKKATKIGLALAMLLRLILLFGISIVISLQNNWYIFDWGWAKGAITGQSIILLAGGLFLLYKATQEIYEKVEDIGYDLREVKRKQTSSLVKVIVEITMINIVFSFDSIVTALGMTNGLASNLDSVLLLMIIAVVISVGIMLLFAHPVSKFVNTHPSVQVLGLAFLLLIGFNLIAEGAHMADLVIFHQESGVIPKGYLYFALFFCILVEFLNYKFRSKKVRYKKSTDLLDGDSVG